MIDKTDLLVSSDYNSLYPSAMALSDSKWPKLETAKAIDINVALDYVNSLKVANGGILTFQDSLK